jgi:hypothetical protein
MLCALGALAGRGEADPRPSVRIEYDAPPECPDAIRVRAGVIGRLGYDPFASPVDPDVPRLFSVRIERGATGYVATIDVVDGRTVTGTRTLRPQTSCGDAGDALELALAVAIDPAAFGAGDPTPPPAPAPGPTPPPAGRPVQLYPPPVGPPAPPPPRELRSDINIMLGGFAGAFESVVFAFGFDVGYEPRKGLRIGAGFRWGRDTSFDYPDEHGYSTTEIHGEACWKLGYVQACAIGGFGAKSVTIEGDDGMMGQVTLADYRKLYGLAGGRGRLVIPLGERTVAVGTADVVVVLPPVDIATDAGAVRYAAPPVEGAFALGLGYRW